MNNMDTEFVMELFLDDNVSTLNRLIVATANVVNENVENIAYINDSLMKEQNETVASVTSRHLTTIDSPLMIEHDFYEDTLKNFSQEDYYERFKMNKTTVEALINFLNVYVKPGSFIVELDKKVHVFLWLLTNDVSFKEIGELFGLHKSSVSYIFHEIATLIAEQRNQFINWPSLEEQHVTRIKVNSKYGFPNCIGFIDACRLKVGSRRKTRLKPEIILLQAVCDERLMFIDIHVGDIGITRKGKVFRESFLSEELKNLVDFDNHLLGDSDFKLRMNLITPFNCEEVVTSEEMRFNATLWKAHSYIHQAFDILRDRFRKLNLIDINKPAAVHTLICAACVLHNFVLIHEGSPVKEEVVTTDEGVTIDTDVVVTAAEKRQFLCNYINYMQNPKNF
ncbi:uncharacterized protein LOC112049619 [Bicyclus anynana]|uniref:Protein ALP1-like n=1 Tax=Bicyclus anynana TaxID=110368 RepID=A0A6J1NEB3_BICAN|nr:uncharacterized protein LOC112049619 [Bicyclus anynana]XP_023943352.1 uncharacterized protein LOC112049619 [Bicyclus anynana]